MKDGIRNADGQYPKGQRWSLLLYHHRRHAGGPSKVEKRQCWIVRKMLWIFVGINCWSNTFCSGTEQTTIEMNISSTQSKINYQQWQADRHDAGIGELKTLMVQVLLTLYPEIAERKNVWHHILRKKKV